MAGTEICVGGGQHAASSYATTPQAYVSGFGYVWNPADPFLSVYGLILAQYRPVGQAAGGAWDALAIACMQLRNLLFCNNTPDDCNAGPASLAGGLTTLKAASSFGLSGASAAIGIANAAGAGISSVAGAVIPGVGVLLSAVLAVYQNHVAAEAKQETQLCTECPAVTQIMQQIDAAVASGSASGEQGYSAMAQLSTQFTGVLSGIYKSGNAADGYERIFKCQVALSLYRYGISALPTTLLATGATTSSEGSATVSSGNSNFSGGSNEDDETGAYETPAPASVAAASAAAVPVASSSPIGGGIVIVLVILVGIVVIWGFAQ